MEYLMMISHSKKLYARILTAVFTIGLALVLAFCPIVQTVAYANAIYQCGEVVGFIMGAIGGGWVTSAILSAAEIGTTIAMVGTVKGFIILIAAMGIGCAVSTLVRILTTEESLASFGVEFWRTISTCWDNAKQAFVCSALTFKFLVEKVKSYFGLNIRNYSEFPYVEYNSKDDCVAKTIFKSDNADDGWKNGILRDCKDTNKLHKFVQEYCKAGDFEMRYTNEDGLSISCDNFTLHFDANVTTPTTMVGEACLVGTELFIPLNAVFSGHYYSSFNTAPSINGFVLSSSKDYPCSQMGDTFVRWFAVTPEGQVIYPSTKAEFFYYLLCCNCSPVYITGVGSKLGVTDTSGLEDYKDDVVSLGNVDSSIPKAQDVVNYKPHTKDATYDKTRDVVKGLVDNLDHAISGDVVITGTEAAGLEVTDELDIADAVSITDVAADDVVVEDPATGDPVALPNEGFISWILGLNLIKSASSGLTEKFPFSIPSYLKSQLNILVSDPKKPIFKIPFKIQSADIGGDVEVDLTRFGGLTKITDFFLIAILVVGLCFATKKMFF